MNESEVRFDPLSSYRAPIDTVALMKGGQVAHGLESFADFMAMCTKPSEM
jgi:hypothetical protein